MIAAVVVLEQFISGPGAQVSIEFSCPEENTTELEAKFVNVYGTVFREITEIVMMKLQTQVSFEASELETTARKIARAVLDESNK